jgi:diguanylate cyclase (GGDEF)-like protein
VAITALTSIPAYVIARNHSDFVIKEMQMRARGIASSTALLIGSHASAYLELSDAVTIDGVGTYDHTFYVKMNTLLRQITEATGADFIFTAKMLDTQTQAYILDGTDPILDTFSPIGEKDVLHAITKKVIMTSQPVETELVEAPGWGAFVVGLVPILDDGSSQPIGVVGAAFSSDTIDELNRNMNGSVGASFIFLILLITVGIYILYLLMFRISMEDHLTKLHTRRYHFRRLREEVRAAKRTNTKLSLLIIDVDWLKQVNDTSGHGAGDRLLQSIAHVLRANTRAIDSCARHGGDEFAVILPGLDGRKALATAKKIEEMSKKIEAMPGTSASLSIGLATWVRGMDEQQLMECADQALYTAKSEGKGRIKVYEPKTKETSSGTI